jgi:type IV pilus assembly protein PilP
LKKRQVIFCVVLIGSLSFIPACSDQGGMFSDLLPGFLKSKSEKEKPVVHKLNPTEEIKSSIPTGPVPTPSAVVPIGDEGIIPGKPGPGAPAVTDKVAGKESPGTPTKEGEKAAPPVKTDKNGKPITPDKKEPADKTTGKPTPTEVTKTPPTAPVKPSSEKAGGDGSAAAGEDVAMVALVPEAGAPNMLNSKPINSLMDKEYIYDPTGKRDPFRPFNLKVEKKAEVPVEELTPLQRYNLSQLTLTAIIYDPEKETGIAMVVTPAPDNKGYNVTVGSEVGGGRVVRITESEIQVEMSYEDYYGNTEKRIEKKKIAGGK